MRAGPNPQCQERPFSVTKARAQAKTKKRKKTTKIKQDQKPHQNQNDSQKREMVKRWDGRHKKRQKTMSAMSGNNHNRTHKRFVMRNSLHRSSSGGFPVFSPFHHFAEEDIKSTRTARRKRNSKIKAPGSRFRDGVEKSQNQCKVSLWGEAWQRQTTKFKCLVIVRTETSCQSR